MYLFFDVETTGFPKKWNRPHTDTFNWPRMVQISWMYFGEDQKLIEEKDFIIKPEGFEIPYEAERLHKITTEIAKEEGHDLKEVLQAFAKIIDDAEYVIAHNMNFDANVTGAEFIRKSVENRLFSSDRYCTMQESTYYCKLPGKGGRYKWPSLMELHVKLFGERFKNAHNAKADTAACAKCFFKLLEIEAIDIF